MHIAATLASPLATPLLAQAPAATPAPPTTLLVALDRRPSLSLDGDWHFILDPYLNGTTNYPKDDSSTTNPRLEYDFAKTPTLKVPGDWNTQSPTLLNYEGPLWYERHFTYQPQRGDSALDPHGLPLPHPRPPRPPRTASTARASSPTRARRKRPSSSSKRPTKTTP